MNASHPQKIHIIGVGDDGPQGLTAAALELIRQAQVVLGVPKTLDLIETGGERIAVDGDFDRLVEQIAAHQDKTLVVLTSGDPLFFGVARFLCDRLGKDRFEVLPNVSSMQLAFARVKESWDEAYLANLASLGLERVVEKVRSASKAGLFTTEQIPPSRVARTLIERQIDYFTGYVCENLGSPDERVTQGELTELAGLEFAPLNVMILVRKPDVPDRPADMQGKRLFGNPDEAFLQSQPKRGLLTPMEVRTLALAEMDLGPRSVVWDVGAGSGSLSVEAAQIADQGAVYAIEMDPQDHQLIAANAERFGVTNLTPVLGQAPEAWAELPNPDAVFVGGTGRHVAGLVEAVAQRLPGGGRLVVNVSSVVNLAAVLAAMKHHGGDVRLRMLNIARGNDQMDRTRFEAATPTFLLSMVQS